MTPFWPPSAALLEHLVRGNRVLLAILSGLLFGCAAPTEGPALEDVSRALTQRTGWGLPPEGETEPLSPHVELADGLSEDEAVGLALWNDADFVASLAELEVSRARIYAAGLLRDPALALLFPWGPKQFEGTLAIPVDFLWVRPKRRAVALSDAERVAETLVVHGLDLAREVRGDCIGWNRARERSALVARKVETASELAAFEESRVRAGYASPANQLAAEARVASLRAEQYSQELQVDLAYRRLALRCGDLLLAEDFEVLMRSAALPREPQAAPLLQLALAARPELRATELAMERAAEEGGLARAEAWRVAALIDANEEGSEGFEVGPGVALTLPVFDGGRGRAAVADAQMEREAKRYLAVRRRIAHEVTSSLDRLTSTTHTLETWRGNMLPKVKQEVGVAERARSVGETSRAAVLEARLKLLDARLTDVELEAEWRSAHADLERAVARRLDLYSLEPLELGDE